MANFREFLEKNTQYLMNTLYLKIYIRCIKTKFLTISTASVTMALTVDMSMLTLAIMALAVGALKLSKRFHLYNPQTVTITSERLLQTLAKLEAVEIRGNEIICFLDG